MLKPAPSLVTYGGISAPRAMTYSPGWFIVYCMAMAYNSQYVLVGSSSSQSR